MQKNKLILFALLLGSVSSVVWSSDNNLTSEEVLKIQNTAKKTALWNSMVDASIMGAGFVIFNSSMSRKETAIATTAFCAAAIAFKYGTRSLFRHRAGNSCKNELQKNNEQTQKTYVSTYTDTATSHTPYLNGLCIAGLGGCALYNKYFRKK